ncbi:MAG: glutamate-1-semialdehyde 2,1-aminomutase [Rhodospirillum sp.]|nr:glutamate-1-semialdehyde 2,1-aminomutase [Rhodospirillum sp.]MCF8489115.1 glutamate-1-semialdehyde 2,1-aminomutase [Rhodospirillum sp.]MCF8498905.1 glutamate-1-semialdehyde 2,1-aminomutase [Rhodospirillum sp.]
MEYTLTHQLIPGGAHTYSKGDDQFTSNAPRYLERGLGATVWDDKGAQYTDWTMGLRTMSLGYGNKAVNDAAIAQILKGSNFGRPSYIETETAQDIVDLIPCADMVKFGKNGSTVTTAAVKIARAYTGRAKVAMCKDHPFFSYDDWFIGTTPMTGGIPANGATDSLTFRYNDLDGVKAMFSAHGDSLSCVIMEAATYEPPRDDFLHVVQDLCRRHGALFIVDEMISGFRYHLQGAARFFDLDPDLSTFGKGIANGFSVSALVGKREFMELGGLFHDRERVFLISTTHGSENHGLAACRAALAVYRNEPVVETMWSVGQKVVDGLNAAAADAGVGEAFTAFGYGCNPTYTCRDARGEVSMGMRSVFLQEMVREGILINYICPSYAHGQAEIDATVEAARKAMTVYARALEDGWEAHLVGPPVKPVFRTKN